MLLDNLSVNERTPYTVIFCFSLVGNWYNKEQLVLVSYCQVLRALQETCEVLLSPLCPLAEPEASGTHWPCHSLAPLFKKKRGGEENWPTTLLVSPWRCCSMGTSVIPVFFSPQPGQREGNVIFHWILQFSKEKNTWIWWTLEMF